MQDQYMRMPSVSDAKVRAGDVLAVWENRITLNLGLLILMLQLPLYLALQSACDLICARCLPQGALFFATLVNGVYGALLQVAL